MGLAAAAVVAGLAAVAEAGGTNCSLDAVGNCEDGILIPLWRPFE